jgi:hypothetical protein
MLATVYETLAFMYYVYWKRGRNLLLKSVTNSAYNVSDIWNGCTSTALVEHAVLFFFTIVFYFKHLWA